MHIPDQMLNGKICPVTAAACAIAVVSISFFAFRSKIKPPTLKFAAVSALIFAAQMMNFPVLNGTAGHFLGATMALLLLGIPFGILSMVSVVTIQCLLFADGGLSVLGMNILNMAFFAAIPAIVLRIFFNSATENHFGKALSVFLCSWGSIVLASFMCSLELGISGTISFTKVLPSMLSVHSIIGIFEGGITVLAFYLLSHKNTDTFWKPSFIIPASVAVLIALLLSPFASTLPDGLEWVAAHYSFLHKSAPLFVSPLADYRFAPLSGEMLQTGIAGFIGVTVTFISVLCLGQAISLPEKQSEPVRVSIKK